MSTKESELTKAVLIYCSRCIAEQDTRALKQLRFDRADIELLAELRVADMETFASAKYHRRLLDISIRREAMRQAMLQIQMSRAAHHVHCALMEAGAPRTMMSALYGINHHDYAALQAKLGRPVVRGRIPQATEEQSHAVWRAWTHLTQGGSDDRFTPNHYLRLHEMTQLSLRVIWPLLEEWDEMDSSPSGKRLNRVANSPPPLTATDRQIA